MVARRVARISSREGALDTVNNVRLRTHLGLWAVLERNFVARLRQQNSLRIRAVASSPTIIAEHGEMLRQ